MIHKDNKHFVSYNEYNTINNKIDRITVEDVILSLFIYKLQTIFSFIIIMLLFDNIIITN